MEPSRRVKNLISQFEKNIPKTEKPASNVDKKADTLKQKVLKPEDPVTTSSTTTTIVKQESKSNLKATSQTRELEKGLNQVPSREITSVRKLPKIPTNTTEEKKQKLKNRLFLKVQFRNQPHIKLKLT